VSSGAGKGRCEAARAIKEGERKRKIHGKPPITCRLFATSSLFSVSSSLTWRHSLSFGNSQRRIMFFLSFLFEIPHTSSVHRRPEKEKGKKRRKERK